MGSASAEQPGASRARDETRLLLPVPHAHPWGWYRLSRRHRPQPPEPLFLPYLRTTGACSLFRGCQRPALSVPPKHPSRSGRLRRCPCPRRGAAAGVPPAGRAYGPAPGRGKRGVRCRCARKRGSTFSLVDEGESGGRRSPRWWHCQAWGHGPVALSPGSPAATPASAAAPGSGGKNHPAFISRLQTLRASAPLAGEMLGAA